MLRIIDTFLQYHRVSNLIYQKTSNYLIMKQSSAKEYTEKQMFDTIMKQFKSLQTDIIAFLFTRNVIDLFPQGSIFKNKFD